MSFLEKLFGFVEHNDKKKEDRVENFARNLKDLEGSNTIPKNPHDEY